MRILSLFILTLLFSACTQKPDYVAEVDKGGISQGEFREYLKSTGNENVSPVKKEELLERLIDEEIMARQTNEEMVKVTADKLNNYRRKLLAEEWIKANLKNYPTEDDIKEYYDKQIGNYSEKYIELAHIMIKWAGGNDAAMFKTRNDAAKIFQRLREGEKFEDLAKELSDDKVSGSQGGNLGLLPVNSSNPVFIQAALKLKPGEFSEPIETEVGMHIIKRLEKEETRVRQLDNVKDEIRALLKEKKIADLIGNARRNVKIKINAEKINKAK